MHRPKRTHDSNDSRHAPKLDPALLVVLALPLFAILPLLTHTGLPNTADGPAHLMRQAELNQAWQDGILFPRWAPDLAYGYGAPLFSYAPPLLYALTQVLHLTGLALDAAMKGTVILMLLVYSVGAYLLVREIFGAPAGIVAAAAYVYAPYRLREVFVQGNYGQLCGLAFYPLTLWAFLRLAASRQTRYLLAAAISMALLLLSHNISAMLFFPLLGIYLLLLWRIYGERGRTHTPIWRRLPVLFLAAIAIGMGLSAFFWLPAFAERDFIRLAGITQGFFDFRHNFITLSELLALPSPLDRSSINPYFPLALGAAQVLLAAVGIVALPLSFSKRRSPQGQAPSAAAPVLGILFAAAFLTYGFLTLPQSTFVWQHLPFLELAEFPWRMLGPALLSAAVLAGAAAYFVQHHLHLRPILVTGLGIILAISANLAYLFPDQFIPWGTPGPVDAMAYEVESGAIGTTSTGEFLPTWVDSFPSPQVFALPSIQAEIAGEPQPEIPYIEPNSLPAGASLRTLAHTARTLELQLDAPAPFTAQFRLLYWPGWRLFLSEAPGAQQHEWVEMTLGAPSQPHGLVTASLPAGSYRLRLALTPTPIRSAAAILTTISALLAVGLAAAALIRRGPPTAPRQAAAATSIPWRGALIVAGLIAAAALLIGPLAPIFTRQSPPGQVLGAQESVSARFADQIALLAFDTPTQQVRAGDELTVVLYWQAVTPVDDNYRVFLHLDGPDGQTYASADELNPANIPIANWPPGLYVRNPLTLDLPETLPPIRYTLTAGLYDHHTGQRLPVTACTDCTLPVSSGADALPLAHVWLLPADALRQDDIAHPQTYHFDQKITLLGYDLAPGEDERIDLTLYWQADAAPSHDYAIFVHAIDASGSILGQFDSQPLQGLYPTSAWQPQQIIADRRPLTLPPGTAAIRIGLYDPATLTRLPIRDQDGVSPAEDSIVIQAPDED
jgi:hypothetical protein